MAFPTIDELELTPEERARLDRIRGRDRSTQLYAPARATALRGVLSDRQREIVLMMSDGLSNREIAVALFLSIYTVQSHVQHIFGLLSARSRTHAVAIALRTGVIE